jgi:hypothetical protein
METETLNKIKTDNSISSLYIDSDGVLITKVSKSENSLEELDRNYIQIKSIIHGNYVCGIIDIDKNGELGKNYLDYLEREYSKIYKALAIIAPSRRMRIKALVKRKFSKSKYPVKLFSTAEQAKEWLKGF